MIDIVTNSIVSNYTISYAFKRFFNFEGLVWEPIEKAKTLSNSFNVLESLTHFLPLYLLNILH